MSSMKPSPEQSHPMVTVWTSLAPRIASLTYSMNEVTDAGREV